MFVHCAQPAVIRWVTRLRAGIVPTRRRRSVWAGKVTQMCLICGAAAENPEHIFFGCPALGTDEWQAGYRECFAGAVRSAR